MIGMFRVWGLDGLGMFRHIWHDMAYYGMFRLFILEIP